jgi:trans-L-3-hydroxyproline dehydratase
MYGVIPVEASISEAAFGVLFMHNSGYSTMCGHATIALGRWAVETGRVAMTGSHADFVLEAPCGPVQVRVRRLADGAFEASFDSVPAFVLAHDVLVSSRYGEAAVDIVYGGAYYAIAPARAFGLDLRAAPLARLRDVAMSVTNTLRRDFKIDHPGDADLGFLYGTILTDDEEGEIGRPSANICVFGEGQIDRSPTGSGVTARLALAHARATLPSGARRSYQGPSGAPFVAEIAETLNVQGRAAIRARVGGRAHVMGQCRFVVEPDDCLPEGLALHADAPVSAWAQSN